MNPNPLPPPVIAHRPESGIVTALAVISIIFGTIGLLGSFIPCVGALAIWLAIPSALCGGAATFLAKSKGVSIGFPVAALVVSVLGLVISSIQIMALSAAAKGAVEAGKQLEEENRRMRQATPLPTSAPRR